MFLSTKSIEKSFRPLSLADAKRHAKILVIDNDPNSFPLEFFRREGYTIDYWELVESLERLDSGSWDILILDIGDVAKHLTPDDGLGVLEHIKRYNPSQLVIAFSGQSFDLSKNRFFKLADDTLWKPVNSVKCKETIDQLLTEKFNVLHYWNGVKNVLKEDGVDDKKIYQVEARLLKSLKSGKKVSANILDGIMEKADVTIRVMVLLTKIASIAAGALV